MKQTLLQEKYPVYTLEVDKTETPYKNVNEVMTYLKRCVDEHKVARYIAAFDHYAHTSMHTLQRWKMATSRKG